MARSSSRQNACNWIVALLLLWSTVSLIVIVVWATWPPFGSVTKCRAAQEALTEKMEGARVMKEKEQEVLRSALQWSSENQTRLQDELNEALEILTQTSTCLKQSLQLQMALKENLTGLENHTLVHHREHARLAVELALQEGLIETLRVNLTSESHQSDSCVALCDAARSQQAAAESQRKACQSKTTYLLKQVEKCNIK